MSHAPQAPRIVKFAIVVSILGAVGMGVFAATRAAPDGPPSTTAIETLPAERGGQDAVGKRFPEARFASWLTTEDAPRPRPGQLTLYRWWTDTCPYCTASLPAVERLRETYAKRGLAVVAVYHPKPASRDVDPAAVQDRAHERGYRGAIAIDPRWSVLRRAYLDGRGRAATSISLLVDGEGVIRYVHPGPVYFPAAAQADTPTGSPPEPAADPADVQANADFEHLARAIEGLLPEPGGD